MVKDLEERPRLRSDPRQALEVLQMWAHSTPASERLLVVSAIPPTGDDERWVTDETWLPTVRERLGWTQQQVASFLKVTLSTVWSWENARHKMPMKHAAKLQRQLERQLARQMLAGWALAGEWMRSPEEREQERQAHEAQAQADAWKQEAPERYIFELYRDVIEAREVQEWREELSRLRGAYAGKQLRGIASRDLMSDAELTAKIDRDGTNAALMELERRREYAKDQRRGLGGRRPYHPYNAEQARLRARDRSEVDDRVARLEARRALKVINDGLSQLSEPERRTIEVFYFTEGMTTGAKRRALNLPTNTMYAVLKQARDKLRAMLEEDTDNGHRAA